MATTEKRRANFKLHAPEADKVFLAGTFNDWNPEARPLRRDRSGNWKTWMSLPPGKYEYRFIVNGEWLEDPDCEERRTNEFGAFNSVVSL